MRRVVVDERGVAWMILPVNLPQAGDDQPMGHLHTTSVETPGILFYSARGERRFLQWKRAPGRADLLRTFTAPSVTPRRAPTNAQWLSLLRQAERWDAGNGGRSGTDAPRQH